MAGSSTCWLAVLFVWTATLLDVSQSGVYTSTRKILDMVQREEDTLNKLYALINGSGNGTAIDCFLKFYQARMSRVKDYQVGPYLEEYLKHPNSIYRVIKEFATEYQLLRSDLDSSLKDVQKQLSSIAEMGDFNGAKVSILRLQTIYGMNASDMIRGDYFGYLGPGLGDGDAFDLGETAFREGRYQFAIEWLNEALSMAKANETSGFINYDTTGGTNGRAQALIGRSFLRQGHTDKAREMYELGLSSAPADGNVVQLGKELETTWKVHKERDEDADYKRLCTLQSKLTKSKFDRRLVCSYKQVILPYYRFKMELVSVSPYVALFYEVISDFEGQTVIDTVREYLERGQVISHDGSGAVQELRTSDISFVEDYESPLVAGMSKRVAAITNLVTKPYVEGSDFSCEPFQVVNYGMGGHYGLHFDSSNYSSPQEWTEQTGFVSKIHRLATFLIYLTTVERGGSTVFPSVDIAVSPVKNMALFWYTHKPSGERDEKTIHAGCPVIYGHKWVTNKWMWFEGNTFSRRCGLRPKDTQLDIDQHMRRGWA